MHSRDTGEAALDPTFFEGRWLVEIQTWDCDLHVGLSSEGMPAKYRFQGGLSLVRGFDIEGRIRAADAYRGSRIAIHLMPFGPEIDEWDEVGRLYFHPDRRGDKPPLTATLLIPESTLPIAATCLSSIWKYLHIWTFDEDSEEASVSAFGFDTKIHKNLVGWVGEG